MTRSLGPKKSRRKYGRARKFQLKLDELLLYVTRFFLLSLADLSAACKFHACARATWPSNPLALLCRNECDSRPHTNTDPIYGIGRRSVIACDPHSSGVQSVSGRFGAMLSAASMLLAFKAFSRETLPPPAEHSGALARINSLSAIVPRPD